MHVGLVRVAASMSINFEVECHDQAGKLTKVTHYINQTLRGIEVNGTIVATGCRLYTIVECKNLKWDR
jgi:hypothetical protein